MNYGELWILLDVYNSLKFFVGLIFISLSIGNLFFIFKLLRKTDGNVTGEDKKELRKLVMLFVTNFFLFSIVFSLPNKRVLIEAFVIQRSVDVISKTKEVNDKNIAKIIDLSVLKVKGLLEEKR